VGLGEGREELGWDFGAPPKGEVRLGEPDPPEGRLELDPEELRLPKDPPLELRLEDPEE
jgi:hypothetical protein